jgi:hypothetical protein
MGGHGWYDLVASAPAQVRATLRPGGIASAVAIRELVRNSQVAPGGARTHIRRCNFRRMTILRTGTPSLYEVECLRAERSVPVPLGGLATARPICDSCEATNVFRPDED